MPETITSRPVAIRVGTSRIVLAVTARVEPAPPPAPVIPWPTAAAPPEAPTDEEDARR